MKIEKIIVRNFRLLKDFSIDLEDSLSLVIGRNNVGKTSLLLILQQFLGTSDDSKRSIKFNDLNLDAQEQLKRYMEKTLIKEEDYVPISITLQLIISYTDSDSLANVSLLLMDLDVDNHYLAIGFDYYLPYEGYKLLHSQCAEKKAKFEAKIKGSGSRSQHDTLGFLGDNAIAYFKLSRKSIKVDKNGNLNEKEFVDFANISGFKLESVIQFRSIGARRDVDNRDADKTLSIKTSDLYKAIEESQSQVEVKENFLEQLRKTDAELTSIYSDIFAEIVEKIKRFGGMSENDTVIKIISSLQHREMLKGNTTVMH